MTRDFPQMNPCPTRGCDQQVTRYVAADPRFCEECRAEYGRRTRDEFEQLRSFKPPRAGRNRLFERLRECFRLMGKGEE